MPQEMERHYSENPDSVKQTSSTKSSADDTIAASSQDPAEGRADVGPQSQSEVKDLNFDSGKDRGSPEDFDRDSDVNIHE